MPSQKQKVEKAIWQRIRGFLNMPPAQENMAEYMAARRQIEKVVQNPEFVREAKKQFNNFMDFLLHYDLNVADIDLFMDMDMSEFMKPHRKK